MTTFKDWDNELDKLGTDELAKYNQALDTLIEWDFFKKAYDGYGLPVVNNMLARATEARLNRDERRADKEKIFCTNYDCTEHGKSLVGKLADGCVNCGAEMATVADYMSDPEGGALEASNPEPYRVDKFEITKTKFGEFRVWDPDEIETIEICPTLTEAIEAARNEGGK